MRADMLESVLLCPMCQAERDGQIDDVPELGVQLKSTWRFARCRECRSLWLDPQPVPEAYSLLYPQDYVTHRETEEDSSSETLVRKVRGAVKNEALRRFFGYRTAAIAEKGFVGWITKLLASLSPMKRMAGYSVRFLPFIPNGRVLEIGCGNGSWLFHMKQLGWDVVGIEPDPRAAELARSKGIEVHEVSLDSVTIENQRFDAIVMHHVIEHLPSPRKAILQIVPWLKPAGLFVSYSPNPESILFHTYGRYWRQLDAPRHLVLPSMKALASAARIAGLSTQLWCDMRTYPWHLRECRVLGGESGGEPLRWLGRIRTMGARLIQSLRPSGGEDIVMVATKETIS